MDVLALLVALDFVLPVDVHPFDADQDVLDRVPVGVSDLAANGSVLRESGLEQECQRQRRHEESGLS